jgi:HK97 gp10 family phage protein
VILTLPQWHRELSQWPVKAERDVPQAVRLAAFAVQRYAMQMAPVDTGFLRASITVGHPTGRQLEQSDKEAQIGPEAEYGGWVETGTANSRAQPYMVPAAEATEPLLIALTLKAGMP